MDSSDRERTELAPLASFMDAVIAGIGGGKASPMLEIRRIWPEIAGPAWVDRARPIDCDGSTVVVEVVDGAAASMFRYETARVARQIGEALGRSETPRITIRVARSRR